MIRRCIFYLMSHVPHLPYLLVSLHTLRQVYCGPVIIYGWDCDCSLCSSFQSATGQSLVDICRHLADCFGAFGRDFTPEYRGKNDQFLCKQKVARSLQYEYDEVLYLDADTIIKQDPNELFSYLTDGCDFVTTQFNDWNTSGGTIQNRISRLADFPEIDQELIVDCLNNVRPSVNGGIWCCRPKSHVLDAWYEWTKIAGTQRGREIFIADETVLHLLPRKFPQMRVVHGWNTSPKKNYRDIPAEDVAIWHFHGDSNTRWSKSPEGVALWYSTYKECCRLNLGNVNDWAPHVGNTWLKKLEREHADVLASL